MKRGDDGIIEVEYADPVAATNRRAVVQLERSVMTPDLDADR